MSKLFIYMERSIGGFSSISCKGYEALRGTTGTSTKDCGDQGPLVTRTKQ